MKRIQSFTKKRGVFVGGCLTNFAVIAIVPWRLVAEEAKDSGQGSVVRGQKDKADDKSSDDVKTPADDKSAATPTDKAAQQKTTRRHMARQRFQIDVSRRRHG